MWKMLLFNIIYLIIHSFLGGYCYLLMLDFCLPSHTKEKRDDKQLIGKKKKKKTSFK